jgi:hypothetical protein
MIVGLLLRLAEWGRLLRSARRLPREPRQTPDEPASARISP